MSGFLVQQREKQGLDIEEVSRRTGTSVERLEEIEKDATNIMLSEATDLASLYSCEVAELSANNVIFLEFSSVILPHP